MIKCGNDIPEPVPVRVPVPVPVPVCLPYTSEDWFAY